MITVHKPELYAAAVFRAELAKQKIKVVGSTIIADTPLSNRRRLARDRSMTLAKLLVPFMKLSNNMHAEALTKTMGRVKHGSGSWKSGLAVTTSYLRRIRVPMEGVSLTDGSGLTRRNRITAQSDGQAAVQGPQGALVRDPSTRSLPGGRQARAARRRHVA